MAASLNYEMIIDWMFANCDSGLTNLKSLNLSFTSVSDSGMRRIAGIVSLTSLNLDSRQITDAGLVALTSKNLSIYRCCNTTEPAEILSSIPVRDVVWTRNYRLWSLIGIWA